MGGKPALSFWQIWNMCFGFLGIQFGFALQNANVSRIFQTLGASIDAIYHCPHRPDEGCECRKPGTALAKRAAKEHGADLSRAYVVGDKSSDIGLARNLFAKGVLVLTGKGAKEAQSMAEPLRFLTADTVLQAYGDLVMVAD